MALNDVYRGQAALLVRVLPLVAREKSLALKGGTAINLFIRNMPRLSVDIDLTYLPLKQRPESMLEIEAALHRIGDRIKTTIQKAQVTEGKSDGAVTKLIIRSGGFQIKIEVTPVIRGCVYDVETRTVSPLVEEAFGFAEIQVVSFSDLYAGKIVAALDRQHPRDLFDVRDLLANEHIDDALRRAFIIYLLSHDRPMSEVLAPTRKDITEEFLRGFEGMTAVSLSREELLAARETLIEEIVGNMPESHRRFLISFKEGQPNWPLLGLPKAAELPAVRWRQQNLAKLTPEKRAALISRLGEVLGLHESDGARTDL